MADWKAIKAEYITTDTSYRKLSEKYGISRIQIGNVGKKEGWVQLRGQYLAKTLSKTIDAISDKQAERAAKLVSVADILLEKVRGLIENGEALKDTQSIKHISGVLKDIKDIQMIRSDADMREQEARIENLRKQARQDAAETVPELVVEGLPEEFKA